MLTLGLTQTIGIPSLAAETFKYEQTSFRQLLNLHDKLGAFISQTFKCNCGTGIKLTLY